VLHADDLLSLVNGSRVIGRDIRVFEETTSTTDVVERLARDGVREGVVRFFAETQTRGRGRLGRKWISPARKGLWLSVLFVRPSAASATQLTVAAATALVRAIRQTTSIEAEVKWPNDILNRGNKAAGVLTELSANWIAINHIVLGIGIDVKSLQIRSAGRIAEQARPP